VAWSRPGWWCTLKRVFRDERPRIASFKTHFVKYFYPRVTALQRRRAHPNKALRKLYRLVRAASSTSILAALANEKCQRTYSRAPRNFVRGALTVPRAAALGYALLILYSVRIRHDGRFSRCFRHLMTRGSLARAELLLKNRSDNSDNFLSDNYVAIPKEKI